MNLNDEAKEFLKRNYIKNYTINTNGMIDVVENVRIYTKQSKLPVKFGKITGSFNCNKIHLTSLEGAPRYVSGFFYCDYNQLTSLEGVPDYVGSYFSCCGNNLTSLEWLPNHISDTIVFNYNKITSLHNIHKIIKETNGVFYAYNNPIKDSVLGLLLIKGLKEVILDNTKVTKILNKYISQGRAGVISAQQELLDAGLDEYAKL